MGRQINKFIGTSGWYYPHWNEIFYPFEIKTFERLNFYAQHFFTVEINSTFYHLPLKKTVKHWYESVPDNFVFAIKASRYITHMKRLKDCEQSLHKLIENIAPLKDKLGPMLFQLPPSFEMNLERLESFLKLLPDQNKYVFEFRHTSWYNEEIYDLLRKYSACLCITDLKGTLSPEVLTAKFVYIRLHGPKSAAYKGEYGSAKLQVWKRKIQEWIKHKLEVFCYFDNDEKSYAVKDAKLLIQLLDI